MIEIWGGFLIIYVFGSIVLERIIYKRNKKEVPSSPCNKDKCISYAKCVANNKSMDYTCPLWRGYRQKKARTELSNIKYKYKLSTKIQNITTAVFVIWVFLFLFLL